MIAMPKQEIYHVFHQVFDSKAIIETTMQPQRLIFWRKYKESCLIVEGNKLIAYGDFRCEVGDRDKRELVILATKRFLEKNGVFTL